MKLIEQIKLEYEQALELLTIERSEAYNQPSLAEFEYAHNLAYSKFEPFKIEYDLIREYSLSKPDGSGTFFTIRSFTKHVKSGGFIDYDGIGEYASKDQVSGIYVPLNAIRTGTYPRKFTHIYWTNR